MFWSVLAVVVVIVAGAFYVRVAPSDPARWNVDPLSVTAPDGNGWLLRPDGGNMAGDIHACPPELLLTALDRIATETPRTRRLAGSMAEGQITYVTRSRIVGFPDYTTVAAIATDGGAAPVIYARQRFGQEDLGVNRARVEAWVDALRVAPECPVAP